MTELRPPTDAASGPIESGAIESAAIEAEPDVHQAVDIRDLRKRYGDTIALDGLSLTARPGEILGIAGPNGAGKSTLIKILAGEAQQDAGEILIDGGHWSPSAGARRVAVVHQEPQLFPNLTVAENIVIGRERRRFMQHGINDRERAVMADLAILEYADRDVERVSLAVQQRTEIARALAQDARVFLFDEPNSALTEEESNDLFRRMHRLADEGRVVILVSHRLAELVAHCRRVAIILDGQVTRTLEGPALTQDAIARQLVVTKGDRAEDSARARVAAAGGVALRLDGWSHARGEFSGVDLEVRGGEIVGIVGVEGSGARELVRSIAGFEAASGRMDVAQASAGSSATGTGFVPADRRHSLFSNLSVGENMVIRLGSEIAATSGRLRRRRMIDLAHEMVRRFSVKVGSIDQPIRSLSGGNQQKVAIAAAVVPRPHVLVLEEPTRGVDVGSKREIYRLLRDYAAQGEGVIMYCTEVTELFEATDRAHVVSGGRISAPLGIEQFPDVESLASEITAIEARGSAGAARPEPAPA